MEQNEFSPESGDSGRLKLMAGFKNEKSFKTKYVVNFEMTPFISETSFSISEEMNTVCI